MLDLVGAGIGWHTVSDGWGRGGSAGRGVVVPGSRVPALPLLEREAEVAALGCALQGVTWCSGHGRRPARRWASSTSASDLRHTGNTMAAATGASTKELMVRMGHASPQAALIYQHATADRDQAIAAALSDMASKAAVVPIRPARDLTSDSLGHVEERERPRDVRAMRGPRSGPEHVDRDAQISGGSGGHLAPVGGDAEPQRSVVDDGGGE